MCSDYSFGDLARFRSRLLSVGMWRFRKGLKWPFWIKQQRKVEALRSQPPLYVVMSFFMLSFFSTSLSNLSAYILFSPAPQSFLGRHKVTQQTEPSISPTGNQSRA